MNSLMFIFSKNSIKNIGIFVNTIIETYCYWLDADEVSKYFIPI